MFIKNNIMLLVVLLTYFGINCTRAENKKLIWNSSVNHFIKFKTYLPGPGIHIVAPSNLGITQEFLEEEAQNIKSMASKGYVEELSEEAQELLNMDDPSFRIVEHNDSKYDTELKADLSAIKLAFQFKGIPITNENIKVIGFSAAGTWLNDKGWTSIAEYFKDNNLGVCQYFLENVALAMGGISLREDLIRYDVNNKYTNLNIEGSEKSGFLYSVHWYDDTYFQTLSCATKKFDRNHEKKVINFAKKIDKKLIT